MTEGPKLWKADDIPSQQGRVCVVTGANSGLGLETAKGLATHGAEVILACRSLDKAAEAESTIRSAVPGARLVSMPLDLASLASVRAFADAFAARHAKLDLLVNNAGIMAIPYMKTADGFEMQLGTNHLGHFALTGLLLERLIASGRGRVVTVSSTMHRIGKMDFDDLLWERRYKKWPAYGRSKLANLLFTFELQRRLEAKRLPVIAVAAHPGYAATNLQRVGPRLTGSSMLEKFTDLSNRFMAQSAAMGALPTLRAATDPEVEGGTFWGPDGAFESSGHPHRVTPSPRAKNLEDAKKLWDASVRLTGVGFDALR